MNENYAFLMWLEMIFGIANPKTSAMIQKYGDARTLYYVLHDPETKLMDEREKKCFSDTPIEKAFQVIEYCRKNYISIMSQEDSSYPEGLRHIYNAPLILFYRGNPDLLRKGHMLTVVGTRRPSQYSQGISQRLCYELADSGLILVSGCAVGMDASAHDACIHANTPTVGVMGCGVDYDYPKENRMLKERIVQNGLLISEYFPATPPYPANFPVRNRILSGISEGVLVLEASKKSGSLITANIACEQGKYVFCIPPADIYDGRYGGQASLLRDGAYPVFGSRDIVDVLNAFHFMGDEMFPEITPAIEEEKKETPPPKPEKYEVHQTIFPEVIREGITFPTTSPKNQPSESNESSISPEPVPESSPSFDEEENDFSASTAPEEQEKILNLIKREGAQNVDSICVKLGISFEDASVLVVEMELMGLIQNSERDLYVLSDGDNSK